MKGRGLLRGGEGGGRRTYCLPWLAGLGGVTARLGQAGLGWAGLALSATTPPTRKSSAGVAGLAGWLGWLAAWLGWAGLRWGRRSCVRERIGGRKPCGCGWLGLARLADRLGCLSGLAGLARLIPAAASSSVAALPSQPRQAGSQPTATRPADDFRICGIATLAIRAAQTAQPASQAQPAAPARSSLTDIQIARIVRNAMAVQRICAELQTLCNDISYSATQNSKWQPFSKEN